MLVGPQLLVKVLYYTNWLIYGMISKKYTYVTPLYAGVSLLQMICYLIYNSKWDQIVYQLTIIINTAWCMRKAEPDDILLCCSIITIFL